MKFTAGLQGSGEHVGPAGNFGEGMCDPQRAQMDKQVHGGEGRNLRY